MGILFTGGLSDPRNQYKRFRRPGDPETLALAERAGIVKNVSVRDKVGELAPFVQPILGLVPGGQAIAPFLGGGSMPMDPRTALAASQGANNPTLPQTADLPWWLKAGIDLGGRIFGGSNGNGGGGPMLSGNPCPSGFEWDGQKCVQTGVRGAIERFLPGGESGTGADVYGQAVVGAFGKPALVPFVEAQPTRRCPPGAVLGKDNLCYDRRSIRNSDRKWPKPPKPPITVADRKAIRRAASAQRRVKRLAGDVGFTCRPKGRR